MITITFDVNDNNLRSNFFDTVLINCITNLPVETKSLWGKMSAHDMIEHLIWSFDCSIGTFEVHCHTPENILERAKRFLYDNRPTPQNYKNPLIGEDPFLHHYSTYSEAKDVLLKSVDIFKEYFNEHPDEVHIHPVFGPLSAEEWQRSQYKHCFHHLLQFGILSQAVVNANGT
jgi:hypothetical protein